MASYDVSVTSVKISGKLDSDPPRLTVKKRKQEKLNYNLFFVVKSVR